MQTKKAVSEHAEVKQEHRELAGILSDVHYHLSDERTCATCNSDFSDIRHIPAKMRAREYMSQLLADHDAEVERRLLVRDALALPAYAPPGGVRRRACVHADADADGSGKGFGLDFRQDRCVHSLG